MPTSPRRRMRAWRRTMSRCDAPHPTLDAHRRPLLRRSRRPHRSSTCRLRYLCQNYAPRAVHRARVCPACGEARFDAWTSNQRHYSRGIVPRARRDRQRSTRIRESHPAQTVALGISYRSRARWGVRAPRAGARDTSNVRSR